MTESSGEIIKIEKAHDSVCLGLLLEPENSENPEQIWEWRIGYKVRVKEV